MPESPDELADALGVAGELRAVAADAVVEMDLTGARLQEGAGPRSALAEEPPRGRLAARRDLRACSLGTASGRRNRVTIKDLATGESSETFRAPELAAAARRGEAR